MAFWRKISAKFQASDMTYEIIPKRNHKIQSFQREFHLLSKSSSDEWEVSAKCSNFKSSTGLLQMNLLQNTTFTSSSWWGHEEVSSILKRRYILEDLHSVLKLYWSCTNAEMLPLNTSLQSHPKQRGQVFQNSGRNSISKNTVAEGKPYLPGVQCGDRHRAHTQACGNSQWEQ